MKPKLEVFCTIGPRSLNKSFLKFTNRKVDLVRINLSHVKPENLQAYINRLKKNTNVDICIDTEGAQIRTKIKKVKKIKKNSVLIFYKKNYPYLYPNDVFDKLRKKDVLSIGFDQLKVEVIFKSKNLIKCKVLNSGLLENNKGVVVTNRDIKLSYLTENDFKSIEISKKNKIKTFALSFTNKKKDVLEFVRLLPECRRIYKIESKQALKNFNEILKCGDEFLIDRGDLSKETSLFKIPINQRNIISKVKKAKKKVYVATNFLESMIHKPYPTRAEINDIYTSLEMGADGLVLAAETAIGSYPIPCIEYLKKIIDEYKKSLNKTK